MRTLSRDAFGRWATVCLIVAGPMVVVACGNAQPATDARGTDGSVTADSPGGGNGQDSPGDASVEDATFGGGTLGVDSGFQWPTNYVDGSGGCGDPDAAFPTAHLDCCASQSCLGYCSLGDAGAIGCDCFGVAGGCSNGTVCCTFRHACTTVLGCEVP